MSFSGSNPVSMGHNSSLLADFNLDMRDQLSGKTYLKIGNNALVGGQFIFETRDGEVEIGDRVLIEGGMVICRTKVTIADDVVIETGVCLYDHASHSLDYSERQKDIKTVVEDYRCGRSFVQSKNWSVVKAKEINIHSNAWIGRNATILKGVTIGEGAIVAPFSVVFRSVSPWTLVAGNPAVPVRNLDCNLK